ncbi:MAG TPA: hypothetical protein VJH75_04130 [Patescibacteria group bacterium]|nr:hypothetical protein [Patescibacteria group bacterium]
MVTIVKRLSRESVVLALGVRFSLVTQGIWGGCQARNGGKDEVAKSGY